MAKIGPKPKGPTRREQLQIWREQKRARSDQMKQAGSPMLTPMTTSSRLLPQASKKSSARIQPDLTDLEDSRRRRDKAKAHRTGKPIDKATTTGSPACAIESADSIEGVRMLWEEVHSPSFDKDLCLANTPPSLSSQGSVILVINSAQSIDTPCACLSAGDPNVKCSTLKPPYLSGGNVVRSGSGSVTLSPPDLVSQNELVIPTQTQKIASSADIVLLMNEKPDQASYTRSSVRSVGPISSIITEQFPLLLLGAANNNLGTILPQECNADPLLSPEDAHLDVKSNSGDSFKIDENSKRDSFSIHDDPGPSGTAFSLQAVSINSMHVHKQDPSLATNCCPNVATNLKLTLESELQRASQDKPTSEVTDHTKQTYYEEYSRAGTKNPKNIRMTSNFGVVLSNQKIVQAVQDDPVCNPVTIDNVVALPVIVEEADKRCVADKTGIVSEPEESRAGDKTSVIASDHERGQNVKLEEIGGVSLLSVSSSEAAPVVSPGSDGDHVNVKPDVFSSSGITLGTPILMKKTSRSMLSSRREREEMANGSWYGRVSLGHQLTPRRITVPPSPVTPIQNRHHYRPTTPSTPMNQSTGIRPPVCTPVSKTPIVYAIELVRSPWRRTPVLPLYVEPYEREKSRLEGLMDALKKLYDRAVWYIGYG